MSARPFIIAANWKMNKGPSEAVSYMKDFVPRAEKLPADRKIVFFVPAIDLWVVGQALRNTKVGWGAQNCYFEKQGAFSGENSPAVLAEILATHTLVGHSERRTLFSEDDATTAKKVRALHEVGIEPMLCVGETLQERESNQTESVIRRQLKIGLSLRDPGKPLTVAYEPVWAIGTGRVATPQQANEAHEILRNELISVGGKDFSEKTPILYGGSVKPENAKEIGSQSQVDGFLVGGASLTVESFWALVQA